VTGNGILDEIEYATASIAATGCLTSIAEPCPKAVD